MNTILPDQEWWKQLEPQWKRAFQEIFFRHTNDPGMQEFTALFESPALRFAGPSAPFPNMSFQLTNLSGILQLHNLEILVLTHQRIETIQELKQLPRLKSLFLFNNQITSLCGVEELFELEQLYVQYNNITSIRSVQSLLKLKELYIHNNCISSLEGLTEAHAENLEFLICKPNNDLRQKEILRVERELGIRCKSL